MAYHLDLTLQRRATLSAAVSTWSSQKVKKKITNWSDNHRKLGLEEAKNEWQQLTKEVIGEVNGVVLPPRLRAELLHAIIEIGEKILNWYTYIWYEYYDIYGEEGDIIKYIDQIYWTPNGTVDEVKILQSFWLKHPELDVAVMYNIACKNALEEDIEDLWQKIPSDMKDCDDECNAYAYYYSRYQDLHYDHFILAYWKYRRDGLINHHETYPVRGHLSGDELERVAYYSQSYSVRIMFLLSVFKGYSTAVEYFWKKLTQEEKDRSVLYSAYIAVSRGSCQYRSDNIASYKREKYVEILMFIMNQMTLSQKESFLTGESVPYAMDTYNIGKVNVKKEIFSMFLSIWPWQELFMSLLNDLLKHPEHNKQSVLEALFEISRKIEWSSYAAKTSKYRSIFHEVWLIIPGSMKRRMILDDANLIFFKSFIVNLFKVEDLDSIRMIYNDPEIEDVRMQYIEFGRWGYENLIESNKYELLDQFMEEVLRSEEEQKYLKSLVDPIDMCYHLIDTRQYDSANKFLNWAFEMAEERKLVKDYCKNNKFSIYWVLKTLKLYGGSVDKAKEETSRFLEWILETEDDIVRFKRELIVYFGPLFGEQVFVSIGRRLSEEEAQKIRQILT